MLWPWRHACAYAQKLARDNGFNPSEASELEHKYSITGLLHDFDYERFPSAEQHPFVGNKLLEERGYAEDVRRAILSHADYSGVPRQTHMEKVLFACRIYHCYRPNETFQVVGRGGLQVSSQ